MSAILKDAKQDHISLDIDNAKLQKILEPKNKYMSDTTTQLRPKIYTAMINRWAEAAGRELRSAQKNIGLHL